MSKEENAKLATSNSVAFGPSPKASVPAASLPRVLVLSEDIPQTRNAGGIVLWRLFAGYGEGEKLKSGNAEPEPQAGTGPSQKLKNEHDAKLFVIGPKTHAGAELLACPYRELSMPLRRLETSRFSVWKRSLQALGLIPLPSQRKIQGLLGDFRPDVVVSVMQNTPWILTVERTAGRLGIPFVLIVHDVNEEFEKVFPWAERALFKVNRRVYRSAARRLCVSAEMAKFLEERYGVPGEVMYPNRSEELQPRPLAMSLSPCGRGDRKQATGGSGHTADGQRHTASELTTDSPPATSNRPQAAAPLTLGYAGSLAYGYGEALVALISVLRETGARVLMSTPRPPEKLITLLEATDVVEWMPHRADINEMWRTMQERADVMILPYANPAGPHELLYRTHFPSKLTEYLALGMPVIVSGPEFATGVKWARGEGREARGRRKQPAAADQETKGQPEVGGLRPETGDRSLQRPADQELKRPKDKETEATPLEKFERGDFEILEIAPNGAVPCTTREELAACLLRLRQDGELRRGLAERAIEAGCRDFDPREIRKVLEHVLCEVVGESRNSH